MPWPPGPRQATGGPGPRMQEGGTTMRTLRLSLMGAVILALLSGPSVLAADEAATQLSWSSSGPIGGLHCTQFIEGTSPLEHTWRDNYLCADRDLGLRWSSTGPIAGMTCTQIIEGAEPLEYTWRDNYLCLPNESPLTLRWSADGPVAGLDCVQLDEGSDPYGWHDNYLCWSETAWRADLLVITEIRNIKPASGLDAAGQFVFGVIGAAASAVASGGISVGDLYDGARFGVEVGEFLDQQFSGQDDLIVDIDGRTYLPEQGSRLPYLPMQAGQVDPSRYPGSDLRRRDAAADRVGQKRLGQPGRLDDPRRPKLWRRGRGGAGARFRRWQHLSGELPGRGGAGRSGGGGGFDAVRYEPVR